MVSLALSILFYHPNVFMGWCLGVMFGPYGGQQTTEKFEWKATANVSKDVAPHMGFLYFSGHAW